MVITMDHQGFCQSYQNLKIVTSLAHYLMNHHQKHSKQKFTCFAGKVESSSEETINTAPI